MPWRLAPILGGRGTGYEAARTGARGLGRELTLSQWHRWSATVILVQNRETRRWLPLRHRHRHTAVVLPYVILNLSPVTRDPRRG